MFEALAESKWLARFYDVSLVLCEHLGKSPKDLFGESEAKTAEDLVKALKSERIGIVLSKVAAHRAVFGTKSPEERSQLALQADVLSKEWVGTRTKVICPACESTARLQGAIERVSRPFYDGEQLLEKNVVLANRLECPSCGFVLLDIDELHIGGIEPHFEYFEATELHDSHESDQYEEYYNM